MCLRRAEFIVNFRGLQIINHIITEIILVPLLWHSRMEAGIVLWEGIGAGVQGHRRAGGSRVWMVGFGAGPEAWLARCEQRLLLVHGTQTFELGLCLSLPCLTACALQCVWPSPTKATFPPQPISVLSLNKNNFWGAACELLKGRLRGKNTFQPSCPRERCKQWGQWPSCYIQYRPWGGWCFGPEKVRMVMSE